MSTASHIGFRSLGRGTGAGILVTLLLHGAIGALLYLSQKRGEPRPEATRDLVVTQLVKLGKPREKYRLPRITEPPRPKPPPPQIKLTDNPNAAPSTGKEEPRPKDPEPSKNLQRALQRARALSQAAVPEESNEGELTGSTQGTANQAQEGDAYATAVYEAIRRNWSAPSGLVNESELAGLVATIKVNIAPDGALSNASVRKSSGNRIFDDSCMQAVSATAKVPPPPAAVAAQFRRGLLLDFEGKNLAR